MTTITENELTAELQEMYMQATHWLQDISFLETEPYFFRNIIERYQPTGKTGDRTLEFVEKVKTQNQRLADLRQKIPVFLNFLEPYIKNVQKPIDLGFLDRYNALQNELSALFNTVRATKNELFHYTESIMQPAAPTA